MAAVLGPVAGQGRRASTRDGWEEAIFLQLLGIAAILSGLLGMGDPIPKSYLEALLGAARGRCDA